MKYYVCEKIKSFDNVKDIEKYLNEGDLEPCKLKKVSVIHGDKCKLKIKKVACDFEDLATGNFKSK